MIHSLALPYPGFSWSITQHTGPGTNVTVLFALLQAAQAFGGERNCQAKITEYLVENNILTPNIRKDQGREQAWRDYQQILSELGLIVSTRFTSNIIVTPVGLLLLDGGIGYSELMATQCFNYQYPNGHKQALSPSQKKLLSEAGIKSPDTRTELDSVFRVQIKPAVLILRVLIEGFLKSTFSSITPKECLHALVPIKSNINWEIGYNSMLHFKKGTISKSDTRRLRHVQEWFRLLAVTDVFTMNEGGLTFTASALSRLDELLLFAELQADPKHFWVPATSDRNELGISWFKSYGNPDVTKQWMRSFSALDADYISENYPDGIDSDSYIGIDKGGWSSSLSLSEIDYAKYFDPDHSFSRPKVDPENILKGHVRRHEKTLLHNKIVGLLAKRYVDKGFKVFEDKNSVDLLAIKGDEHSILEVKTVTPRSLSSRIRLGVGQLCEYRYRREIESHVRPNSALVISNKASFPKWMIKYFNDDLDVELLSLSESENFYAYTSGANSRVLVVN